MVAARQQTETTMATIGTLQPRRTTATTGSVKDAHAERQGEVRRDREGERQGARLSHSSRGSTVEFRAPALEEDPAARGPIANISRSSSTIRAFPAPIYASLVKGDGDDSFILIWSRRNGD